MSHQVTITRTTTTTTTSAILVNTGYMRSWSGLLKILQTVLGAVCLGIVAYYVDHDGGVLATNKAEFFFLLITTTFLIGTFCLLSACLLSLSAGTVISKTLYELIYHTIAFILYLAASLRLIIQTSNENRYRSYHYDGYMAASVIGLVNTVLYFLSAVLAYRSYRLP